MKKNRIELTAAQREELEKFSRTGVHSARLINRAKIILMSDVSDGRTAVKQEELAKMLSIRGLTVCNVRKEFREAESVSKFLSRKKRLTPPVAPKVTGEIEAYIIALACSAVPEGCARWTVRVLADKCVELNLIDSLSYVTVSRILKKHNFNLT